MFWNPTNNYLGIGTSNPNFPIDVESSVSHTFSGGYGWLNTGGASSSGGNVNGYFSLYAASRIASQEFDAVSDARIKNVIGPSDTALDLATLKKLKITDYRYIEVVEKGNQRKKGVIAQEVEKVYPDAVRIISNFVPSVYAMAVDSAYNEASHELTVTARKAHGFAVGDIVRIIVEGVGNVDRSVAATLGDDTFVLSGMEKAPPSQVFIFGKKVEDFRVVDYDQLFSMNISATQQLAEENQELKARIPALEEAVSALQKQK